MIVGPSPYASALEDLPKERFAELAVAWRKFRRNRAALVGFIYLAGLSAVSLMVATGLVPLADPNATDLTRLLTPPSTANLLGTDASGRDELSRVVHAAFVSIPIGLSSMAMATMLGVALGAVGGYFGSVAEILIMRFVDVVLSIPPLVFIIVLIALLGRGISNLILVIAFLSWPPIARLVHGQVLSLRNRQFVAASRVLGAGWLRLLIRHIIPNSLGPVFVNATFGVANAILLEAGLSFLGLGVQPPTASWGNMLQSAQSFAILEGAPWLWIVPGAAVSLTVLAVNFVGDGLNDALDPRA